MSEDRRFTAIRHMLEHSIEAVSLLKNKRRQILDKDRLLSLALVRLLEIIGESANRIPIEEKEKYPGIPWSKIIGLRNRLIHGYDSIDFDILWEIVKKDLPVLISGLREISPSK